MIVVEINWQKAIDLVIQTLDYVIAYEVALLTTGDCIAALMYCSITHIVIHHILLSIDIIRAVECHNCPNFAHSVKIKTFWYDTILAAFAMYILSAVYILCWMGYYDVALLVATISYREILLAYLFYTPLKIGILNGKIAIEYRLCCTYDGRWLII